MSKLPKKPEGDSAPVNIMTDPIAYLDRVFDAIRKRAKDEHDLDFPVNVRASPGFTEHGKSTKSRMQVAVLFPEATVDGHYEVIARWNDGFDRSIVRDIVCIVPQILNGKPDRNAQCLKLAIRWGLDVGEGGLRAAKPGRKLREFIEQLEHELGPYPHHGVKFDVLNEKRHKVMTGEKPPQKSRMHKVACDKCGIIVRQSQGAIDEYGIAWCPRHKAPMTVHYKDGEEPDQVEVATEVPLAADQQDNAEAQVAAE